MNTSTASRFHYVVVIRQLNSKGSDGIVDTFSTFDEQQGRCWLANMMEELSRSEGFPVVQTIGGLVPVISQVFKTAL